MENGMKSLSQKVLERKAQRRRTRAWMWVGAITIGLCAVQFYSIRRRTKLVTEPSWAAFTSEYTNAPLHETVLATNVDGVPDALMINGEMWDISRVDHFKDAEGRDGGRFSGVQAQTYCKQRMIAYIPTQNPVILKVNLWHEVMHAGACLHGGDTWWNSPHPTAERHEGVKHLGEFLAEFSRDNPGFVAWEASF